MDVIVKQSTPAYDKLLETLKETGQEHVAVALEGEVLKAQINAHFGKDVSVQQQNKTIHLLRNSISTLVCSRDPHIESLVSLMESNGFEVAEVREGSILLTFRCYGEESIDRLKLIRYSLDAKFTETFCPKFPATGLERITIDFSDDELVKCAATLKENALMSDEHKSALEKAAELDIEVTGELLDKLSLTTEQKQVVIESTEQVKTLMRIISRRPDSAFKQLIDAVLQTGQSEQAAALLENEQMLRTSHQLVQSLPVELLELVLMRTFIKLFTDHYRSHYKTHEAMAATYSALAAVCYSWWQTMNGWPESTSKYLSIQ